MAAHARAIRARAASAHAREQEQRTIAQDTVDAMLDGSARARQSCLDQFLCNLASPELVSFMQERERRLEQRH